MKKTLWTLLGVATFCFITLFQGSSQAQEPTSTTEQTLSIIKPDAVAHNDIGAITTRIEGSGLRVVASKMMHLSKQQAEEFYAEHKERSFFPELVQYMTSGPVVVMTLEGPDAITTYRNVMGPTNPAKADAGTLRAVFGTSIEENAVHGSDSAINARREIAFFFNPTDLCPRTRGS